MEACSRKLFLIVLCLSSTSSAQNFNTFRSCLLDRGFRENRIVPRASTRTYNDLNYQFRLNPPAVYPIAYVLPSRESDVVTIVGCGRRSKIELTTRCGGHQYEKFAYGNGTKVVIDLRRMNDVTVNSGKTATIGGGTILGPMSYKLWKNGRVFFPIGLCPMVGIGGLAPGGGHGYFTRNFGLTTDFILEANIVTASGSLLTVNSSTNSDLYWALRGGGGASFGVITKFVFKVLTPPDRIFEGVLNWNMNSFPRVFDAWQKFFVRARRQITPNFRIRNGGIELHFFDCTGTSTYFREVEDRFPRPRNRTTSTYTYPEFALYSAKNFGGSLRPGIVLNTYSDMENLQPGSSRPENIKTKSFFVPRLLSSAEIDEFHELLKVQPTAVRCRLEGYGGAVNDIKDSDTAFYHRRQNGYNARATVDYTLVADDDAARRTAIAWVRRFFNFGVRVFGSTESYQNYPDLELGSSYLERYYGGNLPRLIRIKRKYDPDNYFNNPQSIPTRRPGSGNADQVHHEDSDIN